MSIITFWKVNVFSRDKESYENIEHSQIIFSMTQHQVAEKEYRISAVPDNKIEEFKMVKMCLFMGACACR